MPASPIAASDPSSPSSPNLLDLLDAPLPLTMSAASDGSTGAGSDDGLTMVPMAVVTEPAGLTMVPMAVQAAEPAAAPAELAASPAPTRSREADAARYPRQADAYELLEEIGREGTAIVWRARCVPLGEDVAVKVVNLDHEDQRFIASVREQIAMMSGMSHGSIVKYYCSFTQKHELWVVMQLMDVGSCGDIMRSLGSGIEEEAAIAAILRPALQGLAYLHSRSVIHRDFKADNLRISRGGVGRQPEVRVGGFAQSCNVVENGDRKVAKTFVGTMQWMAPEIMAQSGAYDSKADIWSFGITALELAHGRPPLEKSPAMKVMLHTIQKPPPELVGEFSPAFKEMVATCLQKEVHLRPTAAKLLEHRFFKLAKSDAWLTGSFLKRPMFDETLGQRFAGFEKQREVELQREATIAETDLPERLAKPGGGGSGRVSFVPDTNSGPASRSADLLLSGALFQPPPAPVEAAPVLPPPIEPFAADEAASSDLLLSGAPFQPPAAAVEAAPSVLPPPIEPFAADEAVLPQQAAPLAGSEAQAADAAQLPLAGAAAVAPDGVAKESRFRRSRFNLTTETITENVSEAVGQPATLAGLATVDSATAVSAPVQAEVQALDAPIAAAAAAPMPTQGKAQTPAPAQIQLAPPATSKLREQLQLLQSVVREIDAFIEKKHVVESTPEKSAELQDSLSKLYLQARSLRDQLSSQDPV